MCLLGGLAIVSASISNLKIAAAEEPPSQTTTDYLPESQSLEGATDYLPPSPPSEEATDYLPESSSPEGTANYFPESPPSQGETDYLPASPYTLDGNDNIQDRTYSTGDQSIEPLSNEGTPNNDIQRNFAMTEEDVQRLMKQEEERRKQKNGRRGRLRELEDTRTELAQKQLELLQKEQELLDRDQSLAVLREELELERKIRALLTKEKEQAVEEAALARGLCAGASLLP